MKEGHNGIRLVAFLICLTTFKAKQRSSLMAQDGRPDTSPGQGRRRVDRTRAYKLNLYGSPLRTCFCGSRKCFHGHGSASRQHRGESTSRAPCGLNLVDCMYIIPHQRDITGPRTPQVHKRTQTPRRSYGNHNSPAGVATRPSHQLCVVPPSKGC